MKGDIWVILAFLTQIISYLVLVAFLALLFMLLYAVYVEELKINKKEKKSNDDTEK